MLAEQTSAPAKATRQGHPRSRPPRGRAYSDDRVVDAAIRGNRSGRPAGTATQPDPAPLVNFSSALATRWVPTSEEIANKRGDRNVARRLNRVRKDVGAVRESELPIRGYDAKSVPVARTGQPALLRTGPRRPDGSSVVVGGNYTRPMTGGGGSTGLGGGGTGGTGGTRGSGCVGSSGSGVGDVPLGPSCRQNAWLAGSSCGWPCGSAVITWVTV